MKIIIVGCGKIGQSILQSLISEGHEIVVVDSNREVIDSVSTNYDVMGICAAGTHFKLCRTQAPTAPSFSSRQQARTR